jgi:hypothetical protein
MRTFEYASQPLHVHPFFFKSSLHSHTHIHTHRLVRELTVAKEQQDQAEAAVMRMELQLQEQQSRFFTAQNEARSMLARSSFFVVGCFFCVCLCFLLAANFTNSSHSQLIHPITMMQGHTTEPLILFHSVLVMQIFSECSCSMRRSRFFDDEFMLSIDRHSPWKQVSTTPPPHLPTTTNSHTYTRTHIHTRTHTTITTNPHPQDIV